MLHVVEFGKLASIIGHLVLLELVEGLPRQVEMAAILYDPAALFEHPIYILPRAVLWSGGHGFSIPAPASLNMWRCEV